MVRFKYILCPIDFSDTSIRALTYATALAGRYEAELEVLHVVSALEDGAPQESIMTAMHRSLQQAGAGCLDPTLLVQEGRAPEVIAYRAQAQPADLLVMGSHGRGGFNRVLLGSVTERVLRTARCPALTVPPAAPALSAAAVTFKRILCAVDYSPSANRALQYALELGRQVDGRISVLYALEYMDPEEPCEHVDFDIRKSRQHFIDPARERLHKELAREPAMGHQVEELVVLDRAYKAILRHATASEADLIVMGAQGTAELELMVYGSNTQHVVRAATGQAVSR